MVQYSINDISKRTRIAQTMESLVDSALVTQPRAGGPPFRIATVTAFFLRDLQPPAQVVGDQQQDRKSTRLNSSHLVISYAVFCLKKKNKKTQQRISRVIVYHVRTLS